MPKAINVIALGQNQSVQKIATNAWVRRIIFYIFLLLLWDAICASGIWPDYLFPTPLEVWNSLVNGFVGGGLYLQASLVSLQRLVIGYGISLVIGLVLGLLIGRIRLIEETVGSVILTTGIAQRVLVTTGNPVVWPDRPGHHLCCNHGRALLDYAGSGRGCKEYVSHLPQGCPQPGGTRGGSLWAGDNARGHARNLERAEARVDICLALTDGR